MVCELRFLCSAKCRVSHVRKAHLRNPTYNITAGGENGKETENSVQSAGKAVLASLQPTESQSGEVCQGSR